MSLRSSSQTLITGVYRSGTEFVTQLLSAHPHISATMYRVNVLRFSCGRFDPIDRPKQWRLALDEIDHRLQTRYSIALHRDQVEAALQARDTVTYGVLYDAVMTSLYLNDHVLHWAEKCQLLWREIPGFLNMMPNGRAILVVRDPRSILASFKHYTYAQKPAYLGAIFNSVDAMTTGLRWARDLPKDRFLIVRYEDAASDPDGVARRMHEFLQLAPVSEFRDQSTWRDVHGRPWSSNSSFHASDDTRAFDIEASINRWKQALDQEEIGLTEAVCGETMAAFGYQRSSVEMNWPGGLRLFMGDDAMTNHFRRWLMTGEGIEAFPSDPLNPINWRKE